MYSGFTRLVQPVTIKRYVTMRNRRSDYDITDDVHLTSADSVRDAVLTIFRSTYTRFNASAIKQAFEDCERLFEGDYGSYLPCDTLYHDKQHSMDMTLALARLISGRERSVIKSERINADYAVIAIITALFHDSGYIRHDHDHRHFNGAEYTAVHVGRSAEFLKRYLHKIGLGEYAQISANMVHYTGYEVAPENIRLPERKLHLLGYMLGSADLIAQMSDRCYLEKCRDRLYPEFVLGGLDRSIDEDGNEVMLYESGEDLLRKTPHFYEHVVDARLNDLFGQSYNFEKAHFDGQRPYINQLGKNQAYLKKVLAKDDFTMLRRIPPENYGTRNFPGLDAYLDQYPLKKAQHS